MSLTAIVPMRRDSERVKGKNYRAFGGLPLYAHIVETLLCAPGIDRVAIDSDSEEILTDAAARFPQVLLLVRPPHLRDGATPMNEVLENTIECLDSEHFLQTHSTNPLLTPATVGEAVRKYFAPGDHDSLFGVTRLQCRLYDEAGKPINHDPRVLLRTQDLPPVYLENSNLYLFSRSSFTACKNRIGARPILFEIDPLEATDIDTEREFLLAEALYEALRSDCRPRKESE